MRIISEMDMALEDFIKQNNVTMDQLNLHPPEVDPEDGDSIILWHGTTRSRAKGILRYGFRSEKTVNESSRGFTFLTSNPAVARSYAKSKAKIEGDLPVVIMCSIDLRRYDNFQNEGNVYIFGYECLPRGIIRDVEGLPKRQLKKIVGRQDQDAEAIDVALTFNSGRAGIAYWINSYLKLDDPDKIPSDSQIVDEIRGWLDEQLDSGKFGEVPDNEMQELARRHLAQYSVEGIKHE